jgi:hypothetical protein
MNFELSSINYVTYVYNLSYIDQYWDMDYYAMSDWHYWFISDYPIFHDL